MKNKWRRNQYNAHRVEYGEKIPKRIYSDKNFTIGDKVRCILFNGTIFKSDIKEIGLDQRYKVSLPNGEMHWVTLYELRKIEEISDYDIFKYKIGQEVTYYRFGVHIGHIIDTFMSNNTVYYQIKNDININEDILEGEIFERKDLTRGNTFEVGETGVFKNYWHRSSDNKEYIIKNIFEVSHTDVFGEFNFFNTGGTEIYCVLENGWVTREDTLKRPSVRIFSEVDPFGEEDWSE